LQTLLQFLKDWVPNSCTKGLAKTRERSDMYRSYYHLSAKPFQISADPRFLWLGDDHKEALATLRYGLAEGNGYVVLVGEVGTGKTTLVNALLATLGERVLVANINHPTLDVPEFFTFVARTYDPAAAVASKTDCLHFFKAFLQQAHADGKRVLLVID
jgi:general secretion pathway protein A